MKKNPTLTPIETFIVNQSQNKGKLHLWLYNSNLNYKKINIISFSKSKVVISNPNLRNNC